MVDETSDLDVDSAFHADARTMVALVVTVLIGAVATAAGVGGGAIYIPIFNTLIGFALKPSTALSQACITAGSLAAAGANLPRTHPSGADVPLIDFPLMLMLTPVLLVGVGIGVLLNVMLPSWLLNILLLVLLLLLLAQAIAKGRALWKAENTRKAEMEAAAAEAAAMGADGDGVDDVADVLSRGGPSSGAVLPTALSAAGAGLRHRRGMSYSNLGPDADADVQLGFHSATADGASLPFDVLGGDGGGGADAGRLDPAFSAVAAGDGDVIEMTPADSPGRNLSYGAFGTPRTLAAASRASLETAASWMAFNELGFVESDGEGSGSDSEATHAFSARSNFSLPVFMRPSESAARLLSMLALRRLGRRPEGPLLERRASFDPHSAEVMARAAAAGEGAGAEPDSWLARRSKWRSRFPQAALPHLSRPPPPPLQQQRSTSLIRNRSVRQQGQAAADDDADIAQPLLDRQVGHDGAAPRPDPKVEYGSAATAAATSATESEGGGRGDRSGAAGAEAYRPPTSLETLHEEAGEEMVSRGASLTDQSRAATQAQSRIGGAITSAFLGSPFAAAAVAIEEDGEAAAPATVPAPGTATTADRDTQIGRRSSTSAHVEILAAGGDGGSPYGSSGALAHRRYGSKSLSSLGAATAAPATPMFGHLELEGPAARDGGAGIWRGHCQQVAASGAVALRKSRSKWAAALRRVPRSYALALLAAWVLYLLLQALRAVQQRCEPAWWALFFIQICAMLAISIGTVVLAQKTQRAQAACLEGRSCTTSLTAPAPPSSDRTDGLPPPPLANRKSGPPAAAAVVDNGNDASASASVLVLRAPLATLAATFGAGLTGGLLGLGGGMVMGPLLLQLGVHPQVTAATSGVMVLFSSSSALAQFAMLHRLNVPYAVVFGASSLVAGLVGTNMVARAIKRSGRPSLVVLALAGVMAIGTLCVGIFGMRTAVKELEHGATGFQGICAGGAGR